MKPGKINFLLILFLFVYSHATSEDKILTAPLINLEELKPSYEELEISEDNDKILEISLKEKNNKIINTNHKVVNLMGLDKITAKTSEIKIKIGEAKKFGLLEIKAIKCGKTISNNTSDQVAYIQIKDTTDDQSEKVFIFNGWTFSSTPSLTPVDHPIYDVWLVGCDNV